MVEKWSFVSMGEVEYRRKITCILKGKSITIIIIQIVICFKHKNVQLLCAFTIVHDK